MSDDRLVVIHQPDFMPYLGFFDRLLKADIYVVLDCVQYERRNKDAWNNRDRIKTANGVQWLSISTKKAPYDTKINEIIISEDSKWRKKHINLLTMNYKKCKFFDEIMPYITELYNKPCKRLVDFNIESIKMLMQLFGINIEMIFAHELNPVGNSNQLNVDIVKKVGCHRYLSGVGAKDYHDQEYFDSNGVEIVWQEFNHPIYPQQYGAFVPYLSSIDLLLNCGIEESRRILRNG